MLKIRRDNQGAPRRAGHKPTTGLLGSPVTPRRQAHPAEPAPVPGNIVWVTVDPSGMKIGTPKTLDSLYSQLLSYLEELRSAPLHPDEFTQEVLARLRQQTSRPLEAEDPGPEPTAADLDAALDQLDPETTPARDAKHFRRIIEARRRVAEAEAELRSAVRSAREAGDSWTVIGAALDTSRQAAFQRFGKETTPGNSSR